MRNMTILISPFIWLYSSIGSVLRWQATKSCIGTCRNPNRCRIGDKSARHCPHSMFISLSVWPARYYSKWGEAQPQLSLQHAELLVGNVRGYSGDSVLIIALSLLFFQVLDLVVRLRTSSRVTLPCPFLSVLEQPCPHPFLCSLHIAHSSSPPLGRIEFPFIDYHSCFCAFN